MGGFDVGRRRRCCRHRPARTAAIRSPAPAGGSRNRAVLAWNANNPYSFDRIDWPRLAATNIEYRATVSSSASSSAVAQLLRETDAIAEIHNTVRVGVPVELVLG